MPRRFSRSQFARPGERPSGALRCKDDPSRCRSRTRSVRRCRSGLSPGKSYGRQIRRTSASPVRQFRQFAAACIDQLPASEPKELRHVADRNRTDCPGCSEIASCGSSCNSRPPAASVVLIRPRLPENPPKQPIGGRPRHPDGWRCPPDLRRFPETSTTHCRARQASSH